MAFSLDDILKWSQECTSARLANAPDLVLLPRSVRVERMSSLGGARSGDLAFFFSLAYQHELPSAQPSILIIAEAFEARLKAAQLPLWKTTAILSVQDPYLCMAFLSEKFASELSSVAHVKQAQSGKEQWGTQAQVHPTACVAADVRLGLGVQVGPHCVIEKGVRIGDGSILYPGCYLGENVVLGQGCVLFPNVVIYECCELGDRVRIHASAVLGADGFGYSPRRNEKREINGHQKIYHLGKVVIGSDVELGVHVCIDRATLGETRVDRNAKLDNFVHIAHNCHVGEGAVICGATCFAGSSSIGKYAYIGGMAGVNNKIHIGDRANVGAMSLVSKDVAPGALVIGNPLREYKEHFQAHAVLNRMLQERKKKNSKETQESKLSSTRSTNNPVKPL